MACALYWYHGYGQRSLDVAEVTASVAAYSEVHPVGSEEVSLLPAMLVVEALRRVAIVVCRPGGPRPGQALDRRWEALVAVVANLDDLQAVSILPVGPSPCRTRVGARDSPRHGEARTTTAPGCNGSHDHDSRGRRTTWPSIGTQRAERLHLNGGEGRWRLHGPCAEC
ncbi:MAG: hypothetical protein ACRDZ8_06270 [Acidimicrobiales bacterium]